MIYRARGPDAESGSWSVVDSQSATRIFSNIEALFGPVEDPSVREISS